MTNLLNDKTLNLGSHVGFYLNHPLPKLSLGMGFLMLEMQISMERASEASIDNYRVPTVTWAYGFKEQCLKGMTSR